MIILNKPNDIRKEIVVMRILCFCICLLTFSVLYAGDVCWVESGPISCSYIPLFSTTGCSQRGYWDRQGCYWVWESDCSGGDCNAPGACLSEEANTCCMRVWNNVGHDDCDNVVTTCGETASVALSACILSPYFVQPMYACDDCQTEEDLCAPPDGAPLLGNGCTCYYDSLSGSPECGSLVKADLSEDRCGP